VTRPTVLAERLGERERLGGEAEGLGDLVLGHLDLEGEFGEGRRAAVLQLEPGPGLLEAGQGVAGVDREPDGATRVGDASGDRLADPPGRVGGELESLAPVELLDGVHQSEVALLDEVEEGESRCLVLLRDRHHEPEVRLHELTLGLLALSRHPSEFALAGRGEALAAGVEFLDGFLAGLDGLGETDLVVLGEERVLTDVGQVEPDEILIIPVDAIFGHCDSLFEVWRTDGSAPETSVTIPTIRPGASGELGGFRAGIHTEGQGGRHVQSGSQREGLQQLGPAAAGHRGAGPDLRRPLLTVAAGR
jgi:hypothetical protein